MTSTAKFAEMSDPVCNPNFRRRWAEPPPQKRKRPPMGPTIGRAEFKNGSEWKYAEIGRKTQAAILDRRADAELAFGRHSEAERLAHQAHELREVGP